MRRGPSLWARTGRLEAAAGRWLVRAEAERVAAELGPDPGEVATEAERVLACWRAGGAATYRQIADLVAAEPGFDAAGVRAEAERVLAGRER